MKVTASDPKRLAPARTPSVADRHFDYPGPYPLRQSYIIASTPRSGSTFLSSVLWQTGVLGAPTEYWNCRKREAPKPIGSRMMQRLEAASRSDYLKKLLACRTTKNGIFGVKVQFDDFEEMLRQFPEVLDRLSPVNYIYIERADKVAQAVSMAKAMQTGIWASAGGRPRSVSPAVYNKEMIARCLKKLEEQRFGWLRWFEANKIEPLPVSYETLAADPAATVRKIVTFLGAENDRPQEVPIRMTEPQSDGTNKDWVTRFGRDMENVGAPGPRASVGETAAQTRAETQVIRYAAEGGNSHFLDRFDRIRKPDAEANSRAGKRARLRYEAIIARNAAFIRGARVLDIQCGNGRWGLAALDAGAAHFVGLESRYRPIETARDIFAKFGIEPQRYEFMRGPIVSTLRNLDPGAFDVVLCVEYSALPDLHHFFSSLRKLQPKHVILDTTTNRRSGAVATFHYSFKFKAPASETAREHFAPLAAAPSHGLIEMLCGHFGFRCHAVDWTSVGTSDRVGAADYDSGHRRTYVLDRVG